MKTLKPHVIVVKGVKNCGKTTTIKLSYDQVWNDVGAHRKGLKQKEVRGAIIVVESVRVGWFSLGDLEVILRNGLRELIAADCEVIVCACRSRGETAEYLNKLQARGCEVGYMMKKRVDGDQEKANQEKANKLKEAVYRAVKKVKMERKFDQSEWRLADLLAP